MKHLKNALLIVIVTLLVSIITFNSNHNYLFQNIKSYNIQTVITTCFISTSIILYRDRIKSRTYIIEVILLIVLSVFTTIICNMSLYHLLGKDYEIIRSKYYKEPIYIGILYHYSDKNKVPNSTEKSIEQYIENHQSMNSSTDDHVYELNDAISSYAKTQMGVSVTNHASLIKNDKIQIHKGETPSDYKAVTFFDNISSNEYVVYEIYSGNQEGLQIPVGFTLFDIANKKFIKAVKTSDIEKLITGLEAIKGSKSDTYKYNFISEIVS